MLADFVAASSTGSAATPRPRFAYLLLTHKEPQHIEALAERLQDLSRGAHVVLHHDVTAGPMPWGGCAPEDVHFVERGRVQWGDWSMIEATLRMLRFAMERLDAEWFVLLSGEHRPTVPLANWETRTSAAGIDALAPAGLLADRLRFGTAQSEANRYLARSAHRWRLFTRPKRDVLHRAMGGLFKVSRSVQPVLAVEYVHRRSGWAVGIRRPTGRIRAVPFYRGSQWIAMNRRAAATVLRTDHVVTDWFRTSWIPDETYFQSVLHNQPDLVVSKVPTTFVLATPDQPVAGWMRLTMEDLPAVWSSGAPFARKVDPDRRPEVIAAIDDEVDRLARSQVHPL